MDKYPGLKNYIEKQGALKEVEKGPEKVTSRKCENTNQNRARGHAPKP